MRDIISKVVSSSGSHTCVIDKTKRFSYAELSEDINAFDKMVCDIPGTYILMSARRCYTSIALYVYSVVNGYTIVPVSATIDQRSLDRLIEQLPVKFFYTDSASHKMLSRVQNAGVSTVVSDMGEKLSFAITHKAKLSVQQTPLTNNDPKTNSELYLIFTSGTTGNPKGVSVTEENLHAYLEGTKTAFGFGVNDVFSHISPLTFDFSIHEIFLALYNGAAIAVLRENDKFNIGGMLKKAAVTVWSSVPSTISYLHKSGHLRVKEYDKLRLAFVGGEPVAISLLESLSESAPNCSIYSYYGPTECTVAMMACQFMPGEHTSSYMPLGATFGGHKMLIQDPKTNELLEYGRGDGYIAGPQVTAGYWNNEALTADRFIQNEKHGLLFKTGDVIERNEGERYKFIARIDDDIKIGGYRFDTAACKVFVMDVTDAENAVVIPVKRNNEVVYSELIVFTLKSMIPSSRLAKIFRDNYDNYIQPRFCDLNEFPVTINGKIDTKALVTEVTDNA